MLTDLSITNIAIIDSLHLSLKPGLTILTGETGAGKSIIIDAVGLIMGGRASADLIRSGSDEAVVEAIFDISDMSELSQLLSDSGFPCEAELLVKRSISRAGKNRIFINGAMATLTLLSDISRRLINIYGQHESQTLLRPENQLLLLDLFAGNTDLRGAFASLYAKLQTVRERLAHADEREREAARRLDLLSFQSQEIAGAELRDGEEEQLEEERQLLANAEKLGGASAEAFELLYGGDGALLGQLRRISNAIREIAAIDQTLGETATSLENCYLQLEDAAMTLRGYASRVEADPLSLQRVEDRLDQINRLKRKYGPTIRDILEFQQQVDGELEQIRDQEHDREALQGQCDRLEKELRRCGAELSRQRAAAADALKQALENEARQLAMKNAVIEADLTLLDEPRPTGFERMELLFSPNAGEPPRPLAKIASGGELSRLMLAFKQVLPEGDVPTLVFDEVDSGIGGATSETVGRKLKRVARRQQVLCITHLPQVAVFADQHLHVAKRVDNGRTATAVTPLDKKARIEEISRMLGGAVITDTTRSHAGELLATARSSSP
ncbi:DNA repair protein RecN [Pelobacter propionicus]|uniref:DNA repair protein RecN n=1 Tax=Pelobacter propionicus (strain DSM 2379 / NBRC 103807 / OttBd1) TaxID=338966 RepID=A1APC3_PELPD|nr:DNA repair protein RecN [Pelobacter propionicus]ABK99193.1 DNA replication and repair protein RecN [Pelobacter propionicus DSM 2379]